MGEIMDAIRAKGNKPNVVTVHVERGQVQHFSWYFGSGIGYSVDRMVEYGDRFVRTEWDPEIGDPQDRGELKKILSPHNSNTPKIIELFGFRKASKRRIREMFKDDKVRIKATY